MIPFLEVYNTHINDLSHMKPVYYWVGTFLHLHTFVQNRSDGPNFVFMLYISPLVSYSC